MRKNAVYARQSVEKKDSLSISGQLALCRRAAGDENIAEYSDSGYSGKNTERPDFKRLMGDIKSDKIAALYVYRLDRFSRSVADFGQLWEILKAHGVEFVSVSESFDTKTPMGRAMLHIIMVFAQLERETTAERVRDNYYRRASLGRWPGGPAPFGYDIGRETDESGRSVPTLMPNAQAETVLNIYREYALTRVSLGALAKRLNSGGVRGINRDTWDNVMLSRLLHNPVYAMADEQVRLHLLSLGAEQSCGDDAFDGVHGVLLVGRRSADSGQKPYGTVSVLQSAGIVPAELWLRCQDKLAENRQIGNGGRGRHTWLSGLLKCADCGYGIKVLRQKDKRRMVCSGRYNLAKCTASIRLELDELEAAVQSEIERILDTAPNIEPETELACTPELREIERRIDRLVEAYCEGGVNREYLGRALKRLELEKGRAEECAKRAAAGREKIIFAKLTFEEKKAVASRLIERVDISCDSARVMWRV